MEVVVWVFLVKVLMVLLDHQGQVVVVLEGLMVLVLLVVLMVAVVVEKVLAVLAQYESFGLALQE
jgi:hypothetical protein